MFMKHGVGEIFVETKWFNNLIGEVSPFRKDIIMPLKMPPHASESLLLEITSTCYSRTYAGDVNLKYIETA